MATSARQSLVKTSIFAAVGLAVSLALDFSLEKILPDSSVRQLLMLAAVNTLIALSLNVINGMAGQFSIGHAGFVGIGAYTSAVIAANLHPLLGGGADPTFGASFVVVPVCLVASAAIAALFGLFVGLPSLRLRGDYLAIVTLGFAEIFRLLIQTASAGSKETVDEAWHAIGRDGVAGPFFHWVGVLLSKLGSTNGYQGLNNAGVPLYAGPFWIFGVTLALGLMAWRLKFSGWGRALRALREDEIAAAAVGVDPTRYKVTSFVISAMGGGVAGCLWALMRDGSPVVSPENFGFQLSFDAITMVILGGSGSVSGSVLGAFLITFTIKAIEYAQGSAIVQDLKRSLYESLDLNALRMIVYAAVLIALMILRPEGIFGEREIWTKKRVGSPGAGGTGRGGAGAAGAAAERAEVRA